MKRSLYCYEYIQRPFDKIRIAFAEEMIDVLEHATLRAIDRAVELRTSLKTDLGGLEVGVPVQVKPHSFEQVVDGDIRYCRLRVTWEAEKAAALFPAMEADIEAAPVNRNETQLSLHGIYRPPLGAIGAAADDLVGHRLAEASVHRFLEEIVGRLEMLIPEGVE